MKNLSISVLAGAVLTGIGATASIAESPLAASITTIYLDYSNVIATGSIIFLNRLPIKRSDGIIIYKDVTIQLKSDANGLLSVSPATPVQALSPPVLSANFRAGIYVLPSNTLYGFALTGPGVVPGHVVSKWEVNVTPTKSSGTFICGVPAVFYVGPLADNPFYATRLKPAGITNVEYSYGIVGSPSQCNPPYATNAIVGFSQSGGLLSIASFTDTSGRDHNVPVVTRTYRAQ